MSVCADGFSRSVARCPFYRYLDPDRYRDRLLHKLAVNTCFMYHLSLSETIADGCFLRSVMDIVVHDPLD